MYIACKHPSLCLGWVFFWVNTVLAKRFLFFADKEAEGIGFEFVSL
jgi:hypothetical protein